MMAVATETKILGEAVEFLDSQRRPVKAADRHPGPYPYYGANGQQGTIDGYIFDEPLVLLAEDGGHFFEPNRGIAYKISGKTWVNNHAHVLRPKPGSDLDYLCLVLKHLDITQHLTGTTRAKLTKAGASRIRIPLPALAEQKRIAGILDAADALRAKRRESLTQLDTLLQSTFLDLFGDPVTNPMGWETVPLPMVGQFVSGATPSKKRDDFWIGSIPWVSPKDMKRERIVGSIDHISDTAVAETSIKLIKPDHLLIVVRGMILAHSFPVAINTVPVTINQDMKAIRVTDRFLPVYLLSCLKAQKREVLAVVSTAGHGTKKFDQKAMDKTQIPVPPLDLQYRFATIVESVERQKSRLRAHLAELDALFASLQSRVFNGEL